MDKWRDGKDVSDRSCKTKSQFQRSHYKLVRWNIKIFSRS